MHFTDGGMFRSRCTTLKQERNHGFATPWIIFSKLFAVTSVFLLGPNSHGRAADDDEHEGEKALCHDGKGDPSNDLKQIIWAGNQCETITLRYASSSSAGRSKPSQIEVNQGIRGFGEQPNSQASVKIGVFRTKGSCYSFLTAPRTKQGDSQDNAAE